MSFNAIFYTFAKKQNSTAQPSGTGTTLSVELKENCSVVNPILRVYNTANFNPSDLNYCYINKFSRYYWVEDWEYGVGEWLAHLRSDPLASFKAGIGALSKYVLRSAYSYNNDCVDDFYPMLAAQPSYYVQTKDFSFSQDFTSNVGMYVLGVAANDNTGAGPISYFTMTQQQIRTLINYMLKPSTGWNQSFTGLTDVLYRSIFDPFDYIKSCKWFPFSYYGLTTQYIPFGNYISDAQAQPLSLDASTWPSYSGTISLPSNWLSLEGKYRSNPACHIYLIFNPWGVLELNPVDFSDSTTVKMEIVPDFITGDCLLKIYKQISGTDYFLTQRTAKIGTDINLTASSVNMTGMVSGIVGTAGAIASAVAGGPVAAAIVAGVGSGSMLATSAVPTASMSLGQVTGGTAAQDGIATLILTETAFADSNNTEFGRPLCKTKTLSTIPGYIKCADGDNDAVGGMYIEEREEVGQHLTNGFFYE